MGNLSKVFCEFEFKNLIRENIESQFEEFFSNRII